MTADADTPDTPDTDPAALGAAAGPCIFEPCVATWRHWHGGFPGGYNDPADPTGPPIDFEGDDPEPLAVRDYNGAALSRQPEPQEPTPRGANRTTMPPEVATRAAVRALAGYQQPEPTPVPDAPAAGSVSVDAAWGALVADILAATSETGSGRYTPALHPARIAAEHRPLIEAAIRAEAADDRPPLDPATVADDATYMAGLVRGRELEREAADAAPAPSMPPAVGPHPNEPHEFRTTCLGCGKSGWLHVALITPDETVTISGAAVAPVGDGLRREALDELRQAIENEMVAGHIDGDGYSNLRNVYHRLAIEDPDHAG